MIINKNLFIGELIENADSAVNDLRKDKPSGIYIVFISERNNNMFEIVSHREYIKRKSSYSNYIAAGIGKNKKEAVSIVSKIIEKILESGGGSDMKAAALSLINANEVISSSPTREKGIVPVAEEPKTDDRDA